MNLVVLCSYNAELSLVSLVLSTLAVSQNVRSPLVHFPDTFLTPPVTFLVPQVSLSTTPLTPSVPLLVPHVPLSSTPVTPPIPLLVPATAVPIPSTTSGFVALRNRSSSQWEAGWCWGTSEFCEPLERRGEVGDILHVGVDVLLGGVIVCGLEVGVGLWWRLVNVGQAGGIFNS